MRLFLCLALSILPALALASSEFALNASQLAFPGKGRLNNIIATVALPRSQVQALLPKSLVLGTSREVGFEEKFYPVMFFFGTQEKVGLDVPPQVGLTYHEFILVIPYTHLATAENSKPLNYLPRFYVDNMPAKLMGIPYYYPKVMAQIVSGPDQYRISSTSGHPLFEASVRLNSSKGPALNLKNFNIRMTNIFTSPLVASKGDKLMGSQFEWDFPNALAASAMTNFRISKEFAAGLDPATYATSSLTESEWGTFWIHAQWRLSNPFRCSPN